MKPLEFRNEAQIFRIFDLDKKQYVNAEDYDVDCYGRILTPEKDRHLKLEWALGYPDKNGTYLFDGDIVENIDGWRKAGKRGIVKTSRCSLTWLHNESFGWEGEELEHSGDCIKIGTVNENPELLEQIIKDGEKEDEY